MWYRPRGLCDAFCGRSVHLSSMRDWVVQGHYRIFRLQQTFLTHSVSPSSFPSCNLRSQDEWAFNKPKHTIFFRFTLRPMGNKVSSAYKRHSDAKSGHKKKAVSPVPSHPSSMTSQESVSNASDIIRQGRKFHNFSESTYWLPNDEEEMDRLVGVSAMIILCPIAILLTKP